MKKKSKNKNNMHSKMISSLCFCFVTTNIQTNLFLANVSHLFFRESLFSTNTILNV